jgi:two-component SAPR family response regulator
MRGDKLAEEMMKIRDDIPLILCTGYSKQASEDEAKALGIRAYVMKPLTQQELANTVRRILDES